MRKLAITSLALALTGCGTPLESVKSGTMNFDSSITISQAIDNWDECVSTTWQEIKTKNGRVYVEAECIQSSVLSEKILMMDKALNGNRLEKAQTQLARIQAHNPEIYSNADEYAEKLAKAQSEVDRLSSPSKYAQISKRSLSMQWLVKPNDEIELAGVYSNFTWTDGKTASSAVDANTIIQSAYENRPQFSNAQIKNQNFLIQSTLNLSGLYNAN